MLKFLLTYPLQKRKKQVVAQVTCAFSSAEKNRSEFHFEDLWSRMIVTISRKNFFLNKILKNKTSTTTWPVLSGHHFKASPVPSFMQRKKLMATLLQVAL